MANCLQVINASNKPCLLYIKEIILVYCIIKITKYENIISNRNF